MTKSMPHLLTSVEVQHLLGQRLKELRLRAGFKRTTLAERSGVSPRTLQRFEDTGQVSLGNLLRLAHALGRLAEFAELLDLPAAASLAELEGRDRERAPRRGKILVAAPSTRKLDVHLSLGPDEQLLVGTLAERRQRVYFEYHADWLARGLELSPFTLPAGAGLIEHTDRAFGPLPGLFDDSLPDGWGLLLMDRHFRQLGIEPATISPLDRLAYLGTQTMGALTYHPPAGRDDVEPAPLDLHDLARQALKVHSGQATEVLPPAAAGRRQPGRRATKGARGVRSRIGGGHLRRSGSAGQPRALDRQVRVDD